MTTDPRRIAEVNLARVAQFRADRWQNIAGQFVAGAALVAIAWPVADHGRLLLFGAVHHLTTWILVAACVLSMKGAPPKLPRIAVAGLVPSLVVLSSAMWFDPSSAPDLAFALSVGIVAAASSAGALATLGAHPGLLRIALTALVVPYVVACLAFGHWSIALGSASFYLIVVVIAVTQVARRQDELVELRLDAADRARVAETAAETDQLTGLLNRYGLLKSDATSAPDGVSAFFIDLDDFKAINDEHGHATGDDVLKIIARRLTTTVDDSFTITRLGGDEFLVLAFGLDDAATERWRSAIASDLSAPISIGGMEPLELTASVGAARTSTAHVDIAELLRLSDKAMYEIKAARSHRTDEGHNIEVRRVELSKALDRGEFRLWFQPILSLHDLEITAFEGLARWQHPTLGTLPPAAFLSDIEASGLDAAFAETILRQAVEFAAATKRCGRPIRVAINPTGRDLAEPDLVNLIAQLLGEHGVAPNQLAVELTENDILDDAGRDSAVLNEFITRGIATSMDDFGTGYSSLDRLRLMPLTEVKIDRSFVQRSVEHPADRIVLKAMVDLGRHLHLSVVGEGIETVEHFEMLRDMGCDLGQGWLFSRAIAADDALQMLRSGLASVAELDRHGTVVDVASRDGIVVGNVEDLETLIEVDALSSLVPEYDPERHGAFAKGLDGRFLWSNERHRADMGFADGAPITGMTDADVHGYDKALRFRNDDLRVITTGRTMHELPEVHDDVSHDPLAVTTTKMPIRDTSGEVVGIFGFYRYTSGVPVCERTGEATGANT